MKKVLIFSKMVFPETSPRAFRTSELAKELSKRGFEVVVYAPLKDYDYSEYEKTFNLKVRDLNPLFFFKRANSPKSKFFRGIDFLLKKIIEYPDIELFFKPLKILKKEKNVHAVISIGIPHTLHWGTAWAKKRLKNDFPEKWIADCGDPYMGNIFHKPFFYFKYIEKFFCKNADYITIPIEEGRKAYYSEFHEKINIIPQGFNFKEIVLETNRKPNLVPTFCYAGSIYVKHRNPSVFLDYLVNLELDFRFIVYTNSSSFFEKYKEALGEKLIIRDFIPRLGLLNELQKMDFVINFENNTSLQLPSKIIDYALIKVPILSVNLTELNTIDIKEFLLGNYSSELKVSNIDQYNIENVGCEFVKLIG